ncbi:hypothetical protein N186_08010 [Thermofilum adornatum]|uniref:Uncharacterized protein n=1 Tax=Thermofilum adornatum TaxID=1365176 RepID=S5Z995_9CREN|nr:hypothetical protein N186_08010 [Thermofilum adornatum]
MATMKDSKDARKITSVTSKISLLITARLTEPATPPLLTG